MSPKIIIIGGGSHARVLYEILCMQKKVKCLGYTDHKKISWDLPYLGTDDVLKEDISKDVLLVNGIGSIHIPTLRKTIFEKLKHMGFHFLSVFHPSAILSPSAHFSEGVQVLAGVVVSTEASIGKNVILNTSSSIDHHNKIGAHTHIAPGVTLSGGVTIGETCHIGTGATVIQNITIGNKCLIGAGSLVIRDISDKLEVMGVPATKVANAGGAERESPFLRHPR